MPIMLQRFRHIREPYRMFLIGGITLVVLVSGRIWPSALARIGLLSVKEVESVTRTYLLLEELPYRLRILVGINNVGGLNQEFIRIGSEWLQVAASMQEAILPVIRDALSTLEGNA